MRTDAMILHFLGQHGFHLFKVGDALFNMIGLLVNDDITDHVIPDEKQDIRCTIVTMLIGKHTLKSASRVNLPKREKMQPMIYLNE